MSYPTNLSVYSTKGLDKNIRQVITQDGEPAPQAKNNYALGTLWVDTTTGSEKVWMLTNTGDNPWAEMTPNNNVTLSGNGNPAVAQRGVYIREDADSAENVLWVNSTGNAGDWQRIAVNLSGANSPMIFSGAGDVAALNAGNYPRGTIYIDTTKNQGDEVHVRSVDNVNNPAWYRVDTTQV